MNERIRELREQAAKEVFKANQWTNEDEWNDLYMAKFTELIVQECAKVCLAQRDPANLNYKPSERFAEAVKQHFGVEQ
jgi:hypothetical protein